MLFFLVTAASVALIVQGAASVRETGRTGSPLLMLGLFPALLCPIVFVHYLHKIKVFRDLQSGRSAIARWTLPAEQFTRFCEEEQRIATEGVMTNFYRPPRIAPEGGVEVIFSDSGVLIGGGYFPLSATRGRRLLSVRYIRSTVPLIEFGTALNTMARTSSATIATVSTAETLRVPVSTDAAMQAVEVVHRFQKIIDRRRV